MMTTVLGASETKTGFAIVEQNGKLEAHSGCCRAMIHFNHSTDEDWYCSSCRTNLLKHDEDGSTSSICFYSHEYTSQEDVEAWVSYWTGFPVECLTVSIRS